MNRLAIAMLALLLVGWAPSAAARTLGPDCNNYGVLVSVANRCDECSNVGIVVWALENCYGNGIVGACVDSVCTDDVIVTRSTAAAIPIAPWNDPSTCGLFEQPCWTVRFACYYVGPPLYKQGLEFYCPTQPGVSAALAGTQPSGSEPCGIMDETVCWTGGLVCHLAFSGELQHHLVVCETQPGAAATVEPCAFFDQPCWTVRFACYYVAPPVERVLYGDQERVVDQSWCPRQPGAGAVATSAAVVTEPCGVFEQPCWTVRFACYYVAPPVERVVFEEIPRYVDPAWCPRQPGGDLDETNSIE